MRTLTRTALSLALLTLLTGCGDLCFMFCTDQTSIQRRYVDARDECRNLAELKAGMAGEDSLDKAGKTRLVGLFSECMNNEGWTVPGPGEKKDKAAAGAAAAAQQNVLPLPNPTLPPPTPEKVQDARAQ